MRHKFICCDVFTRMACEMTARSPHVIDLEFVPMLAHDHPNTLRQELQQRIDRAVSAKHYDKLILGYGLCGNTTVGLHCSIPMILPRMHDCCTMFMGSKENYLREFGGHLSMRWSTNGYYERCYALPDSADYLSSGAGYKTSLEYLQLMEKYDEEDAQYIWDTLHPPMESKEAAYIEMPGYEANDTLNQYREQIEGNGCSLKVLQGDITFFEKLVNGPWASEIFLEVLPGEEVVPVYDMEQVISAKGNG